MTRSVSLAAELAALGATSVVVGSTARLMRGHSAVPRDLDVVVEDGVVDDLSAALRLLGVRVSTRRLLRCRDVHLTTAWGPLDVFVAEPPASAEVRVGDLLVPVAVA